MNNFILFETQLKVHEGEMFVRGSWDDGYYLVTMGIRFIMALKFDIYFTVQYFIFFYFFTFLFSIFFQHFRKLIYMFYLLFNKLFR